MIKIIEIKKAKGGSLDYQAMTQKNLLTSMEQELNDLKPTKVHSVSRQDMEYEFGLVAVIEVEEPAQPLSAKKSKEKQK